MVVVINGCFIAHNLALTAYGLQEFIVVFQVDCDVLITVFTEDRAHCHVKFI